MRGLILAIINLHTKFEKLSSTSSKDRTVVVHYPKVRYSEGLNHKPNPTNLLTLTFRIVELWNSGPVPVGQGPQN